MYMEKFNNIYDEYKKAVWNVTSRYFSCKSDREEAFQESFIRIHKYLPKFEYSNDKQLKAWIYKIAVTTSINLFKKSKRQQTIKEILTFNLSIFKGNEIEINDDDLVEKILKPLNEKQRAVIILREIEDLPYEEIAEIMDINLGTVKSIINRSKKKIKDSLIESGESYE